MIDSTPWAHRTHPGRRAAPLRLSAEERAIFEAACRPDALTFIELLDLVDLCYPEGVGHIINDNLSMHDTEDVADWFDEHPRWKRHFTPKHASWLNQIECAFSILERRVLTRGSFASKDELREKIYAYMHWHNLTDQPFHWTYRPKSWSA